MMTSYNTNRGIRSEMTKHSDKLSLTKFRGLLRCSVNTIIIIIIGATMRGDWLISFVHISKQLGYFNKHSDRTLKEHIENNGTHPTVSTFQGVCWYIIVSLCVSLVSFYIFSGYLIWSFYIKRKEEAAMWKCQPDRWLSDADQRHEFVLGTLNMAIGGALSGIIACYIINGGHSSIYYRVSDRGWIYLFLSTAAHFLIQDGVQFYAHKAFHVPWLYRRVHKWHHRYVAPTPFSATAMHPLEFITYQCIMASPAFLFPLHAFSFVGVLLYGYYYGVIDHSGIKMDSLWPWQPSSKFHDDHHRYFHCNFGFNTKLYDWLHDTIRLDSREYSEDIFGGKGKEKRP